ncbi:MAG TPA: helix-turn-helix domain-containing protein [Burkholderiaceae bacterium]|nr:helix-turn-helix domain-containing protein [Burkholderiaceae bacterium]
MTPQRLQPRLVMPRHRHAHGYIALVLSGGYVEAGDLGRWHVAPGDALVHGPFDAHLDHVGSTGARVLNLPLPLDHTLPATALRVCDADAVARSAVHDVAEAIALCSAGAVATPLLDDWPDQLAAALRAQPDLRIDRWAACNGLAPATVSRGFRGVFGVSPARYRAEARARIALCMIRGSREPLVAVAHDCGFADQAHLSRAISTLTGSTPGAWRRASSLFKTSGTART